jgi:type II secretory pathway pseudopilin PulG
MFAFLLNNKYLKEEFKMFEQLKNKNERGFTVAELMVVLAFIILLAAIAVPSFAKLSTCAHDAVAMVNAQDLYTAAQGYYIDHPNGNPTLSILENYGFRQANGITISGSPFGTQADFRAFITHEPGKKTFTLSCDGRITS